MLLTPAELGAAAALVAAIISFIPWFDTAFKRNVLAVVVLIVFVFTYGGFHYTTLALFWSFFLQAAVYAVTTYVFILEQPTKAVKASVNENQVAKGKKPIY